MIHWHGWTIEVQENSQGEVNLLAKKAKTMLWQRDADFKQAMVRLQQAAVRCELALIPWPACAIRYEGGSGRIVLINSLTRRLFGNQPDRTNISWADENNRKRFERKLYEVGFVAHWPMKFIVPDRLMAFDRPLTFDCQVYGIKLTNNPPMPFDLRIDAISWIESESIFDLAKGATRSLPTTGLSDMYLQLKSTAKQTPESVESWSFKFD